MKPQSLTLIALMLASCGSEHSSPPEAASPVTGSPTQDIVVQYGSPLVFTVNQPANAVPYISDSNALPVTVEPSLPEGLSLDALTGQISGTPTKITAAATYIVEVGNRLDGTGSTTVVIEINDGPLFYLSPISAHLGSALTPVVPRGAGMLTTFSVNPQLPAGLSLDSATGAISGTPTLVQPPTYYKISGSESLLTTVFGINVGVIDPNASTSVVVPAGSTPACVYSGVFVGTYWVDAQPLQEGLILISFTPDGKSHAIVSDIGANIGYPSDGSAGLSLDGNFQFNLAMTDSVSLTGNFVGENYLAGIYANNGTPASFMAARIGGDSRANTRYTSTFSYAYDVELGVLDRTANHGSGVGFEFETFADGVYSRNVQFPIIATFDPSSSTYSWQIPAISESGKNALPASGLTLTLGAAYDDSLDLSLLGCQLN